MKNAIIHHYVGDASIKRHLLQLRNPIPTITEMTRILIVADESDEDDSMISDSHCLSALMAIRDVFNTPSLISAIQDINLQKLKRRGIAGLDLDDLVQNAAKSDEKKEMPHVLCEILDQNTRVVLNNNEEMLFRFEWCVSNDIIAKVLAMVGEQRELARIIEDLLDVEGQEIYVREASLFLNLDPDEKCNFYTIMHRAQEYKELAIGYFKFDKTCPDRKEAILNPHNKIDEMVWQKEDHIITLAKDIVVQPKGKEKCTRLRKMIARKVIMPLRLNPSEPVVEKLRDNRIYPILRTPTVKTLVEKNPFSPARRSTRS
uniref:Uncharacterized protein n=1 Tax=Octactis speculum TaxID=3111310 RepID=A0A7S2B360_9STRA|mmetsp:Transcript_18989/g.25759  ORF Transcript_18989/g.25759 Transcript_18989/m.25759 type:complete len:316 (+) Transcript_18989:3-950(+)